MVPLSTDARAIDNGVEVYAKLLAGNFKPLLDSFNLSWWLVVVISWGADNSDIERAYLKVMQGEAMWNETSFVRTRWLRICLWTKAMTAISGLKAENFKMCLAQCESERCNK